jgi:putative lipoprotein
MVRHSSRAALGLVVLGLAFAFAGCGKGGNSNEKGVVTGSVAYQAGTTLPADASVNVQLADISNSDATGGPVVAETTITTAGQQSPVPFELSYSSDTIDPQHKYAVRATIEADGKALYKTETQYPVITGGNDNDVQIMVVSTGEMPDTTGGETALAGTEWRLSDLAGTNVVPNSKATLKFDDDGKVSGNGNCNNFSGPVTIQGSSIQFGPIASTKKACDEAALNTEESAYFAALQNAESFTVEGTTLSIQVKGKGTPLRFTRTKPAP